MGTINSSAEGRVGYRSAPSTHGYLVYTGRCKRSVLSRVPTRFRPESLRSRRKTLCFQCGGCLGHAQICLLTANSGLLAVLFCHVLLEGQNIMIAFVPFDSRCPKFKVC